MKKKKIGCVLLYNLKNKDSNLTYLTNIKEGGVFLVIKQNSATIYCSKMDHELIKKTSKIKKIKRIEKKAFAEVAKDIKQKTIGINKSIITLNEFKFLKKHLKKRKFIDINKTMQELRETKTNEEVKRIKKACQLSDNIFKETIKNFKKFKTERQVERFIAEKIEDLGCELSFPPLVSSGKRSSMPHGKLKGKLSKGFCYMDFGVKYKGYCSDMTRTIYIGKPTKKEVKDYFKVLNAMIKCEKKVKENLRFKSLDKCARDLLKEEFIHGLGHGLGVDIHESPNFSPFGKGKIKQNMCFTIEPGLYKQNKYGIRIENTYLLSKIGLESLHKIGRNLLIMK